MKKKSVQKIGFGFLFLASGLMCFFFLYQFENENSLSLKFEDFVSSSKFSAMLKSFKKQNISGAMPKDIHLDQLVQEAGRVYHEHEEKRQEGYLWIDRKEKKLIVTLGALQGIRKGSLLSVFDGEEEIAKVTVNQAFDVISFVTSTGQAMNNLKGDYYRVIINKI